MNKPAYQYDHSGLYTGKTVADASPLEPDVYLLPARSTLTAPPADIPDGKWPRWNGAAWDLVTRPAVTELSATDKLKVFLEQNPDVAALINA